MKLPNWWYKTFEGQMWLGISVAILLVLFLITFPLVGFMYGWSNGFLVFFAAVIVFDVLFFSAAIQNFRKADRIMQETLKKLRKVGR